MSDYVYQPYPAWRFHPDHEMRLVHSQEEDEALLAQAGWVKSHMALPSAGAPTATPAPAPQPELEPAPQPELEPAPPRPRTKRKQVGV